MGLDTVELVLETEKHFGISISDEVASHINTVGEFVSLISILRSEMGSPVSESEIFTILQQLIHDMFRVSVARITHEARFIQDLRLE